MNLRNIRIFLTVLETKSMSKAGRQLFMSQSAVSQTINELEKEYHCKLFIRSHGNMELTYAGLIFSEYSEKIMSFANDLDSKMTEIANLKLGQLRIGASTTIGIYIMPDIMAEFKRIHPNINLSLTINNSDIIEQMVLDYKLDVGFVEGENYSQDLEVVPFLDDRLCLICSNNHHWIIEGKTDVCAKDFSDETVILREKGSGTRKITEHIFNSEYIKPAFIYEMHNTEAIKNSVKNNLGITFISEFSIKEELKNNKFHSISFIGDYPLTRSFSIITRKRKYQESLLSEFLYFLNNSQSGYYYENVQCPAIFLQGK